MTVLSPSLGVFISTDEKATQSFSFSINMVESFHIGSEGGI